MSKVEFEAYKEWSADVLGRSEREMGEIMRIVYWQLMRRNDSPDGLPKGISKDGKNEIIVFPGNPREPATVLLESGKFEGRQCGNISRQPNEFDPPFTGVRYIETALKVLDKLAGGG